MKIRMNPRDGIFPKRPKVYISSLNLGGLKGSGVKTSINLRGGISTQRPKIVIFSGSYSIFFIRFFWTWNEIRMSPRDGIFPKRAKLYISCLKLAGLTRSGVKTNINVRGGISTQVPKIVIFIGSCSTFLFVSFGPGRKLGVNPRDGIFPKRTKLYILSRKLAGLTGSEVKRSINLRGGISKQRPKIVIFCGSHKTFLFDFLDME